MEFPEACGLVRIHAQERGEPGFFRYRAALCGVCKAGMVFVDCGDRINGLCGSHAVDRETLWHLVETRTVMHVAAGASAVHITRGKSL